MHFDRSAVQSKSLNSFPINDLRLELFFDEIEDSQVDPAAKATIEGEPLTEFFGQVSPATTIFDDVLESAENGEVVDCDIVSLHRTQMFDPIIKFFCPLHGER
jgi:hypothetical protein